jgi:hypothetical protein
MAFAQLTYRESLRDIEACLGAVPGQLYHLGKQIWIAISVYVLVAIVKKRLNLRPDLYTLLQILSVHIFQRIELRQALSGSEYTTADLPAANQLQLFNF